MVTILRPSRAAFRFSGPDAQKLLNDVVTGRIRKSRAVQWWALLCRREHPGEGLAAFATAPRLDVHRYAPTRSSADYDVAGSGRHGMRTAGQPWLGWPMRGSRRRREHRSARVGARSSPTRL